jgi:hypothetical protein
MQTRKKKIGVTSLLVLAAYFAACFQGRASLVGAGVKWRITNFKQVARALPTWA